MVNSLRAQDIVGEDFLRSVLGTGIAIPHPLGLMAKDTKIVIRIFDKPIKWGQKQTIQVIFLLCISKNDYEEAINIYELLVELVREEYLEKLANLAGFKEFIRLAEEVLKKK